MVQIDNMSLAEYAIRTRDGVGWDLFVSRYQIQQILK